MEETQVKKTKKEDRDWETLFKVTYPNQSSLIQMADNKANIIISINTMIISSIIAITGYGAVAGKIDNYGSQLIVPIVFIMLSCLVSVIFAIQAARPKLIKAKPEGGEMQKSSLLFFGVIASHTQHAYTDEMKKLISEDGLYDHMTIDLYNQGLILKRKYNLLVYAYQVFMFGFIFSVLVFLGFLAFGN
jgi:spermidine/putrescine-binding protein